MSRALVTGATGFVGSNLANQLLQRGWQVGCLVRDRTRAEPLAAQGATLHLGSLSDAESLGAAVADVDTVFHVAGRVRALSDEEFNQDNVEGTRNVLAAAAAQQRPPTTVLVSSLAAGGPSLRGTPRKESDVDAPISAYGQSKLAAERVAAEFSQQVPISVIRPPIIFGQADKASLAIFRGVKRVHLHPVPGYRKFPVSVVHVLDLCDAMVRIAERGERIGQNGTAGDGEGVYYVAAERTPCYGELGKLAARALDCVGVVVPIPKAIFWMIGGVGEVIGRVRREPAVLNLDKIREAVAPGWECDDTKLRTQLDYQPAASLEERFAETAQWYRDQGWV